MNKVQIVSYAKKTETWPNYAECTTLKEPLSPDSFLYNFYDLTDNALWRFQGNQHVSINSIDDFQSIQTMLKKSNSAVNVIVLPQNLEFYFRYDRIDKKYYEHRNLKDIIVNLTDILSDLIPTPFPRIYYENTTTTLNSHSIKASFCFENEKGSPFTFSDGSKKITTCRINDRLFLTTLNIFESPQIFEAFLSRIMPKEDETYPEWLYEVDILDDQEQKEKIDQSERIIGEEQAKIEFAKEKLGANLKYKSILSTNGDALVEVVFEILQELLGCDLSQFQDKHQEDFEIKKENVTFIGEIKGVTSNVHSEHISQLDVHCQNYQDRLQEEGKEETVKGLLIINHQRNAVPQERQEVHQIQIALAERNQSLIVETSELLRLFEAKKMGSVEVSQICHAFKEMTGIFHTETVLEMYGHEDEDNTPYMV